MRDWGDYLKSWLPADALEERVALREKTTLRIGGPASWCVTVHHREDLVRLVRDCLREGVPWFLLGGGSNVLFADRGFEGVVIVTQLDAVIEEPGNIIDTGAGLVLMDLVRLSEQRGLAGFESLAGIPGSVGGAVVGNAGAYGRNIGELVESVDLVTESCEVERVPPEALEFDYRESRLKRCRDVVLSARFRLVNGTRESLARTIEETLATRAEKHPPHEAATAGSFFKNLPPDKPGGRRVAAGLVLDQAGAKGLAVGDAYVFEKHANIVVNRGQASAEDVLALTGRMKQMAFSHAGVILEEEVRRIGFTSEEISRHSLLQPTTV
jgi:UDP-N-acetylmuramate dehydrogenase